MVASGTDSVCLLFCEGSIRFVSFQERLSRITGPIGLPAEIGSSAPSDHTTWAPVSEKWALWPLAFLYLSSLKWEFLLQSCIGTRWNNALVRIYDSLLVASEKSNPIPQREFRDLIGFRARYPKWWHLGLLTILNGRNLRNSRYRMDDFQTFFLKQVLRSSYGRCPPSMLGKGAAYLRRCRHA